VLTLCYDGQLTGAQGVHSNDGAKKSIVRTHILLEANEFGDASLAASLGSDPAKPSQMGETEAATLAVDDRIPRELIVLDSTEYALD
jgi:hypothetical protein